jgi:hypothetical protein
MAVTVTVLAIAAVGAGIAWEWRWAPVLGQWLDEFIRTPGFGALAAVVAATIAYLGVMRRILHDHEVERQRRTTEADAAERQRRWEAIMWVYDNIDTADPRLMLTICRGLVPTVTGPTETALLAAILEERLNLEEELAEGRGDEGEADVGAGDEEPPLAAPPVPGDLR